MARWGMAKTSIEDAVKSGLKKVAGTVQGIKGAWVNDTKVETGGEAIDRPGNFVLPAIVTGLTNDAEIVHAFDEFHAEISHAAIDPIGAAAGDEVDRLGLAPHHHPVEVEERRERLGLTALEWNPREW